MSISYVTPTGDRNKYKLETSKYMYKISTAYEEIYIRMYANLLYDNNYMY